MKLYRKDYRLEIKRLDESGEFEGLASRTGNQDLQGDVVEQGAFKRTLDHRTKSGRAVPVLWQHDFREPIGRIMPADMVETDKGLEIKGRLTMSVARAREARDLASDGVLGGMSIGFDIPKNKAIFDEKLGGRRIKELRLWEVSLVTFPANPKAVIHSVKDFWPWEHDNAKDWVAEALESGELTLDDIKSFLESTDSLLDGDTDTDSTNSVDDDAQDALVQLELDAINETFNKFRG